MAIIKCKMCGGDMELAPEKTFGTCEYCGSTMTLPKVDDDQRAAAFNRGNHFRRIGEFDKALAVYEGIVRQDDTDAEAHWCCALCRFGIEYVEDPATYEWIPTCHRASFDSFLKDVDYLAAVEYSDGITKRQYQKDAAKIAEVQKGILATSQSAEPYDVFICYKESDENGERTRDSALAQDIYYQLTEQGRRVFFARITLEDVVGKQYEPYIFAALNSAKVMVVVGTKPEYLNAVWVKNEWSRFLIMMKKDRSKLLLPCYRDMDPYDMPEQLSVLQSYDMSKIGFLQDLTRGIARVLDPDKKTEPVHETVVVQQTSAGGNVTALLDRGNMALEDGEWEKADGFFEEVLNQDARNAHAYLGKFLVKQRKPTLKKLVSDYLARTQESKGKLLPACSRDREREESIMNTYELDGYLSKQELEKLLEYHLEYTSLLPGRREQLAQAQSLLAQDKDWSRAFSFADEQLKSEMNAAKEQLLVSMQQREEQAQMQDADHVKKLCAGYESHLDTAEVNAKELRRKAEEKREAEYQEAVSIMNHAANASGYKYAEEIFKRKNMNNYKASAELAEKCRKMAKEVEAKEEEKARQQKVKKLAERRKKARKKALITALILVIILVSVATGIFAMLESKYKEAVALVDENRGEAAIALSALGGYKDAKEQANLLWEEFGWDTIDAGFGHSLAIRTDGSIVLAGDIDEISGYGGPLQDIASWQNVVDIGAYNSHAVCLFANGTVNARGSNENGECAVGSWKDIVAVDMGAQHTIGLKSNGTVVAVGKNDKGQCNISDWKDITAISAGGWHTVGLKVDGTVVATKSSYVHSEWDNVSDWESITAISAGGWHTVGLKENGTVIAVGHNHDNQCDVSDWTDIVAVSAGYNHTVGLRADGTVVAVGENDDGECDVSGWSDIVAITAGSSHTLGLKSDGTIIATGRCSEGQCNVSNWTDIKLP